MSKMNIWINYSRISVHKEILLISGCFLKLLYYIFKIILVQLVMDQLGKFTGIFLVKLLLNFKLLIQSTNKYMAVIESKRDRNGSDSGIR